MDKSFVLSHTSKNVNENMTSSIRSVEEMKLYVESLKAYKYNMTAVIENLISSSNASQNENKEDNIIITKKTSGKSSKMENGVSLRIGPPIKHDASQVLNDALKNHLCHDLPGNKTKLFDSKELLEHLTLIEDIRSAENDVMEVQGRLLKTNDTEGWSELRPWNVENYSLPCLRIYGDNTRLKLADLKENVSEKIVYGIHHELRKLRLQLNNKRPKLNIKKQCISKITREYPVLVKNPNGTNLFVNKNVLYFQRFAPGGIYKKTVIITNTGQQMVRFKILSFGSSDKAFNYNYTPRGPLAPGMHAKLIVTFNCKSMTDVYDYITIVTRENKKTYILICAENENPILKYIAERYDEESNCRKQIPQIKSKSDICVFECNACLVGAIKTTTITITNIGRSSKFVCVPEDVWYTKTLEDVEWNKSISFCAFKIVPSIFEINNEKSIVLNVLFKPNLPSFYCSRFIIIADNSCAHEVNVFGDGQMFDGQDAIQLEGRDLRFSHCTATTAKTGRYVLDMGKIGEVVQYVYAKNTSRIKYQFRWIINHVIVKPNSKNAKVNFNIHPSMGLLDNDTMFRVECGVTDEIVNEQLTGEYRVIATMMIDDIPKESINDNQNIFFEEQEDSTELLSVRVTEMEVISVYSGKERISLCVDPVIVDLNWYKLQTDLCVKETVTFVNSGSCPVRVSWIPDVAEDLASVTVYPCLFEVVKRSMVSVRIEPKCAGRLRVALKFRTENKEVDSGETVVYVRGTVERTPEVRVRPAIEAPGENCVGTQASYAVQLKVRSDGPFDVHRRLYELDDVGTLSPCGDANIFGPYGNECTFLATLNFETPIRTVATGISCQLTEWSLDAGSKTVHTQTVTYVRLPDVRLNINTVAIAERLYKGVSFSHKGIRLLNNTHCDFIYSWGNPMGSDANGIDCTFEPATGLVRAKSFVEFKFTLIPKISGHFKRYYVPCFIQCDAIEPLTINVECWANDFSAKITYINMFGNQQNVKWNNKPEDLEPAKWPRRDTLLWSPGLEQFGRIPNHFHSVMAFKDVECNTAIKQNIIIKNPTKISCQVNTKVDYYGYSKPNDIESVDIKDNANFDSPKRCMIWIEKDDDTLKGEDEIRVSVCVLATVWGRYQGLLTIELHVDTEILPAVYIPLIVQAITFPIEYPLALNVHKPTIKFSLYSANLKHRLQILNISEIPIQISWRIYNKSEKKQPFGVVFDTLTPDFPNFWSFRINNYYGLEVPRYFMVEPLILRLEPKEQSFVTFFLDRTKEISIYRNEENIVHGKAVGTVTALESPGKYCIREDGFKLKPTIVKLYSETRHSIYPNLALRELDNIFQVSATQIYNSHLPYYAITRLFTLVNHLQYPVTISFHINSPFVIKNLRTVRCGDRSGNANIHVFYKDLIEIELQTKIDTKQWKQIRIPEMPLNILPRKHIQVEYLYAFCDNSYFKPQAVASFEVHIHFPILKLSTRNINFGQVVVRETKSIDVMLSSYPGPEHFVACSTDDAFTISPTKGIVSHMPVPLTIVFRPKAEISYSNKIKILSTIPKDVIFLDVSGLGIK